MKVNAPKGDKLAGGGTYLKVPGVYHFLITNINAGVGPKGTAIEGFSFETKVLGGLANDKSDQKDKEQSFCLFAPDLTKSQDSQDMTHRTNTNFFLATNCMQPSDLGKEELEIDENLANGHQFIAKLVMGQKQVDGKWVDSADAPLRLHYSDIWHVDDPAVAKIPKNADALALIEPKDRHKPEWFDFKKSKNEQAKSKKTSDYNDDVLADVV